jgi:hypothetical protein
MIMPILHKFMAKGVMEDVATGQPMLVGTIIEEICGLQFQTKYANELANRGGVSGMRDRGRTPPLFSLLESPITIRL